MNPILREHRRRNSKSRAYWENYATHREIITQQILSVAPSDSGGNACGAICLLGAGNCNDVDLLRVATAFDQIHLVDFDNEALAHAYDTATDELRRKLRLHSMDTSGIAEQLANWTAQPPSHDTYRQSIEAAALAKLDPDPGSFDVVVSCCLLSQLIDSIVLTGVSQDKLFLELLFTIRDRHLDQVWEGTKPNGTAILVSDFISSVALPELEKWTERQLAAAFSHLIDQRNFFTGLNPVVLRNKLAAKNPSREPTIHGPWIWSVGKRKFGVCSVIAKR